MSPLRAPPRLGSRSGARRRANGPRRWAGGRVSPVRLSCRSGRRLATARVTSWCTGHRRSSPSRHTIRHTGPRSAHTTAHRTPLVAELADRGVHPVGPGHRQEAHLAEIDDHRGPGRRERVPERLLHGSARGSCRSRRRAGRARSLPAAARPRPRPFLAQSVLRQPLRHARSRGPYDVSDVAGQGGLPCARMGDLDAGERPPLSRERIVAAAIAFVDRRGLTALTMRRLGTELGVEAMSLYRYVAGRDDLLEGMVDQMVDAAPPGPERRPARSGRRLAGLPAVARPRRPAAGPGAPARLPADRDPTPRRAVAAAAAAQPAGGRGLPQHARRARVQRRRRGGRLPRVLQLPARAPAARGGHARQPDGPGGRPRGRGSFGGGHEPHGRPAGLPGPAPAGGPPVRGPRGRGVRAGAGGPAGPARARPAASSQDCAGRAQSAMCRR